MDLYNLETLKLSSVQITALYPWLWLCAGIALTLVIAGFQLSKSFQRLVVVGILSSFALAQMWALRDPSIAILGTGFEVDSLVRMTSAGLALLAVLASAFVSEKESRARGEWAPLLLICVLAMSALPAARNWIAYFIALETLAVAGYVLTAFEVKRERSLEAGLKYLLLGAFFSAFLLLGIVLVFGSVGSFGFAQVAARLGSGSIDSVLLTGLILIVAATGFKVALAPFHMWAPDVYQGGPSALSAFQAGAAKLAVFSALAVAGSLSGFFLVPGVSKTLLYLGAASVLVGNVMAFGQTRLRRLFAYSSVANAGYASLALLSGLSGVGSLITFLLIYSVSAIVCFASVEAMSRNLGHAPSADLDVEDLALAVKVSPSFLVIVFAIGVFSLASIPPLPGFFGKYLVLKDLFFSGQWIPAVWIVFGSLLGIAYYLKVFVPLYMQDRTIAHPTNRGMAWSRSATSVALLGAVVLFLMTAGFSRMSQWIELVEGFAR